MRESEVLRYKNNVNDLLHLGINDYCDLGLVMVEIAIAT